MKLLAFSVLVWLVAACGGGGSGYGGGGGGGGEPDPAYDAVAPYLANACTKCHNGSVHPADFRSRGVVQGAKAKIKTRVSNGSMPPAGNAISAEDKAAILQYVD